MMWMIMKFVTEIAVKKSQSQIVVSIVKDCQSHVRTYVKGHDIKIWTFSFFVWYVLQNKILNIRWYNCRVFTSSSFRYNGIRPSTSTSGYSALQSLSRDFHHKLFANWSRRNIKIKKNHFLPPHPQLQYNLYIIISYNKIC